jgi:SagB-type dehydrogenase family enzyme
MPSITLSKPALSGGKTFMEAVKRRYSCKDYSDKPISPEMLSTLLWVTFGINRPDSGKRTAPSARNIQEVDVYAIRADGVYIYDPVKHLLEQVLPDDLRMISANQEKYHHAPLHLAYVADYSRQDIPAEKRARYARFSNAHAGFIGQNVYLYCASVGLGSCFAANFNEEGLKEALKLGDDQIALYTQIVGYPAE